MHRMANPFLIGVLIALVGAFGAAVRPVSAQSAAATTVNVAVWGQFVEEAGPQPNLQRLLQEFDHPNIDINLMVVPGRASEYAEKVLVMLATLGDEAPDLFIMEPEDANSVYLTNSALPLDGFLAQERDFAQELLFFDRYNGKTVGIPGSVYVKPMAYHAAALNAAGLEDPNALFDAGRWDQETFALYATKVTEREGEGHLVQIGLLGTASSAFNEWPFIWNFGGNVMSVDSNQTAINSLETVTAYEWMADQVVRDAIVIADLEAPGTYERRESGDVVFDQGTPTAFHIGLFPYLPDYVPYPSGPAGRHTMASFQPWMINAASPRTDAAWEVLKFIVPHQAEYQMTQLGNIPNQRSLVRPHIDLQMSYGQFRTAVEAVWNETMNTFTPLPRYPKPEIRRTLTQVSLNILAGRIGAGEALAEASRQINAILAEE